MQITHNASRRLRLMIMDFNISEATPSLNSALKESVAMLRSRGIVLHVEKIADIDQLLSPQSLFTASLFVREAATNVLK